MSIQFKRSDTASLNTSHVLKEGQPGLELRGIGVAPLFKIGDGTTPWSSLPVVCPDPNIYQNNMIVSDNFSITNTAQTVGINCNGTNVLVQGTSFEPFTDATVNLGAQTKRFNTIFASNLNIDGNVNVSSLTDSVIKSVSGVLTPAVAGTDYVIPSQIPTSLPPTGVASGDLAGNYPSPTVQQASVLDTRFDNPLPSELETNKLKYEFKAYQNIGLPGQLAPFATIFSIKQWTDPSGGVPLRIAFTQDNNIWMQKSNSDMSAWGEWERKTLNASEITTLTNISSLSGINGIVKSTNGTLSAAVAGTDYPNPNTYQKDAIIFATTSEGLRLRVSNQTSSDQVTLNNNSLYGNGLSLGNDTNPWNNLFVNEINKIVQLDTTMPSGLLEDYSLKINCELSPLSASDYKIRRVPIELIASGTVFGTDIVTGGIRIEAYALTGGVPPTVDLYPWADNSLAGGPVSSANLGTAEHPWDTLQLSSLENYERIISTSGTQVLFSNKSSLSSSTGLNYAGFKFESTFDSGTTLTQYNFSMYWHGLYNVPTFCSQTHRANLGDPAYQWGTIYATNGSIQTSNRSSKSYINYLDQPKLRTFSNDSDNTKTFTTQDVINFIKKLNPATFVYNHGEDESPSESIKNNHSEYVQLGLIADDIKDEELFNFIGATMEYDKVIEEAILDENGNEITPAVTEKSITLGLKAIPLAVTALTGCKYLLNEIDILKDKISELESKTNN